MNLKAIRRLTRVALVMIRRANEKGDEMKQFTAIIDNCTAKISLVGKVAFVDENGEKCFDFDLAKLEEVECFVGQQSTVVTDDDEVYFRFDVSLPQTKLLYDDQKQSWMRRIL
jgi:hypothetical protein